ncbi:hypothetical protein [Gimesia sp.]|uniref:hypothetical protein n=1 Tax=Gimesia sp. TaxID=2024833 RepID=UPI0025B7E304|nr:hypothetical protein [Gimesia sp.]|tara:strand:- start:3304 stop:3858 length:555 start_codon:yes stop_codon:yes gene_type:complete
MADMIPVGYMAKRVESKPDFLKNDQVEDIYSVSNCISDKFADYIEFWKHNGFWMFNSPEEIFSLAKEHGLSLDGTKIFYYEVYKYQCHEDNLDWEYFKPEKSFVTNVQVPAKKVLEGYDIVSFSQENAPECSYLSCNHMAETIPVNRHCLIEIFDEAKLLLSQGAFKGCEPGPCRIFAVYSLVE